LLFIVTELFSFGWKFTPFTPKQFLYPDTGITKELTAPWVTRTTGNTVIPVNFRMSYGISALEGYDAVYPARAAQYISSLNALSGTSRVSGRYALVDDIHSALVPLASVNSIITSNPSEFDSLRYKTVLTENKTTILEDSLALQNAEAMEVTGDNMRPFGKGTLVLVKPGEARPNDVVLIRCKTGQQFLAQLVHKDQGRAYLRGLKTGDRMQAVKLAKIAGMSRVVASLYP
jgi:hypothetical protein